MSHFYLTFNVSNYSKRSLVPIIFRNAENIPTPFLITASTSGYMECFILFYKPRCFRSPRTRRTISSFGPEYEYRSVDDPSQGTIPGKWTIRFLPGEEPCEAQDYKSVLISLV